MTRPKQTEAPVEQLLFTLQEAGALLRIGDTTLRTLVASGELRSVHIGKLHRIRRRDLMEYIDRLADAS